MKTSSLDFDAQALRDKILDLAMRGKLVSQDPNDEPASVLLEKIKAEKTELIKEKKIKKSKPLPPITDDEKPFDIPDSWEWVRLGDVFEVKGGKRVPKGEKLEDKKSFKPYIRVADMGSQTVDVSNLKYATQDVYDKISNYTISSKNIYFSIAGTIGKVGTIPLNLDGALLTENAAKLIFIDSSEENNKKFFVQALMSDLVRQQHNRILSEVAQPKLALIKLKQTIIPFPPLSEQSRIAAKIAQLFALLRKVESSTQQYANLQTLLKSKVLDLAMRGKLVKQDPNDEPASVLLDKIKAEKQKLIKEKKIKKTKPLPPITDDEKPFDIPDSWEWVRLGDIFSINDRNTTDIRTKVGFLPMKDISEGYDGTYTFEVKKWGEIKSGYTHIRTGDIALAKITPCFQNLKSCIVNDLPNGIGAATTEIYALNPILRDLSYLYIYFLKSPFFINSGMKNFTGNVGQQRVPKKFVETFVIPLPPLCEQRRIVNQISKILKELSND